MSKVEKIINEISAAGEVEIMEFDFKPCFDLMRQMEAVIKKAKNVFQDNLKAWNYKDEKSMLAVYEEIEKMGI